MLGTVGRRYYGMMEMVVAIGDAAEMQYKRYSKGYQSKPYMMG